MNRVQKAAEIDGLKNRFINSQLTILAEYKGLSVSALTDLRRKLRGKQSALKVVKNRLAKIAVKDTAAQPLTEHFVGTVAVATTTADPAGPAKILTEFAKDNELLKIRVGILNGKTLDIKGLKALASLPSKEELIAKLMGSMQAPARNLVTVLSQVPRKLVNVLSAIKDQKTKQLT